MSLGSRLQAGTRERKLQHRLTTVVCTQDQTALGTRAPSTMQAATARLGRLPKRCKCTTSWGCNCTVPDAVHLGGGRLVLMPQALVPLVPAKPTGRVFRVRDRARVWGSSRRMRRTCGCTDQTACTRPNFALAARPLAQVYYTATVAATGQSCTGYTEVCSIYGGGLTRPPRCDAFEKSGGSRSVYTCAGITNTTGGGAGGF